ncbi:MAG: OprO/OprP family phosphate-selective porin [Planctomycetota bacterium]
MSKWPSVVVGLALWAGVFAEPVRADDGVPSDEAIRAAVDRYLAERKEGDDATWKIHWVRGLHVDSPDGDHRLKFGGRVLVDFAGFGDPSAPVSAALRGLVPPESFDSGAELRAAWLYVAGRIYEYGEFKIQYDFAGGRPNARDVFLGLHRLDECLGCLVPDVRVGHTFEPFGLEPQVSSKHQVFMERSLATALAPVQNTGIQIRDALRGDRITYGLGLFTNSNAFGNSEFDDDGATFGGESGGLALTLRLTCLPWAPCECESRLLHVGASATWRRDLETIRYRSRPESNLAPRVVDTRDPATGADLAARHVFNWGADVALVYDQFSLQGEYVMSHVDATSVADPAFSAWYVFASWFLTGESRNFSRRHGRFAGVETCHDFLGEGCRGMGAWELVLRYSNLDLRSGGVNGGEVGDLTAGLNWYLNDNMRVMLNYIHADITDTRGVAGADGTVDIFQVRFQVAW